MLLRCYQILSLWLIHLQLVMIYLLIDLLQTLHSCFLWWSWVLWGSASLALSIGNNNLIILRLAGLTSCDCDVTLMISWASTCLMLLRHLTTMVLIQLPFACCGPTNFWRHVSWWSNRLGSNRVHSPCRRWFSTRWRYLYCSYHSSECSWRSLARSRHDFYS